MANLPLVLERETLDVLRVPADQITEYPEDEWIHEPDLSGVEGVLRRYWTVDGDTVREMTTEEKATVDAEILKKSQSDHNEALWQAAYDHNFAYISGGTYSLMDNIVRLAQAIYDDPQATPEQTADADTGMAMADADQQWVKALWSDYYQRRTLIWEATDPLVVFQVSLDFSAHGGPPYSVGELMYIAQLLGL